MVAARRPRYQLVEAGAQQRARLEAAYALGQFTLSLVQPALFAEAQQEKRGVFYFKIRQHQAGLHHLAVEPICFDVNYLRARVTGLCGVDSSRGHGPHPRQLRRSHGSRCHPAEFARVRKLDPC